MNAETRLRLATAADARLTAIVSDWNIDGTSTAAVQADIKHLTKVLTSCSCLIECLDEKFERGEYLRQIPETLWLSLILTLKGHDNSAHVSLRQSIELFLKHIYFHTHPTEYRWVKRDDTIKEYGFQFLRDYIEKLDEFDNFDAMKPCIQALATSFSTTSRYVHVHSERFFDVSQNQRTSAERVSEIKRYTELAADVVNSIIALLVVFHTQLPEVASASEQSIILAGVDRTTFSAIAEFRRTRALKRD